MKITNEGKLGFGSLISGLGGDPELPEGESPHDCCDTTAPPDRALDTPAFTISTPATGGIVQMAEVAWSAGGVAITATFGATPTNGSTMYALLFTEDGQPSVIDTSGWSFVERGTVDGGNGEVALWSKVAGVAEPTTVHVAAAAGGWVRRLVVYEVAGTHDVSDALSNQPRTSPLVGPTLTPGGTSGVLIAGFLSRTASLAPDPTQTPVGALQTDTFDAHNPGRGNAWTGHQDTTTGSYTPSLTTTALYPGTLTASAAVIVDSVTVAPSWDIPAPNTVDGDDATYQEIDGPDVLRVDLGAAFRIVKARMLIGSEDPGNVTYSVRGANAADFSDAVALGSVAYASTGSFTGDDVDIVWSTTDQYRYVELSGTDENRRLYSFEVYEPSTALGEDHEHADLEDAIDDLAAAIDDLGGSFLTDRDGGGDVISTVAASGSTETIDLTDGNVHDITLDDDCTFTFAVVDATRARSFTLFLRQDGTGGWEATWPGSVVWSGGVAPTLSTDPDAVDVFAFVTLDGGVVWYGFAMGGGGSGSAIEVSDDGVSLTSALASLDFVGAGVTATNVGDDVTVTIPGGASAGDAHAWMPLTTIVAGEPVLVWDGDDNLIPTLTPV